MFDAARRPALILLFRQALHQSALGHYILDEIRERQCLIGFTLSLVSDYACIEVDGNFIAGFDFLAGFRTFQNRKSDIDGISVKYSGESLGDDTVDAAGLDGDRGVFSG